MRQTTKEEAERFFHRFFRGAHHCPDIKPFGGGWKVATYTGLATFDSECLTRLVFLAHDLCVRVKIIRSGPGRVGIAMWQRRTRQGSSVDRHPTLDQAILSWRESNGYDRTYEALEPAPGAQAGAK
jgi:hypothetical protein